jgi:WD40 repeat protein
VDIGAAQLKPLKSPVRLIGSPALLNLAPPHSVESSPERSRKKGFGRDRERQRKKQPQLQNDEDEGPTFGQLKPAHSSSVNTSLEYTKAQNARLLSLLTEQASHRTAETAGGQEARALTAAIPGQQKGDFVERAATSLGVGVSMPGAARFHQMGTSYSDDDDNGSFQGSLEGSLSAESMHSSMEFEPATLVLQSRPTIVAPIDGVRISGFKHKSQKLEKPAGGSSSMRDKQQNQHNQQGNNSNSNSDREIAFPDEMRYGMESLASSLDNSVDSLDSGNERVLESLRHQTLQQQQQKPASAQVLVGNAGKKERFQPAVSLDNRQKRRTADGLVLDKFDSALSSPLLATLKSSSRHSHIPPLAPTTTSFSKMDGEGETGERIGTGGGGGGGQHQPHQPENKGTVLTGHSGPVNHITMLNSRSDLLNANVNRFMISGGSDSTVRLWDLEGGRCVGRCVDPMQNNGNGSTGGEGANLGSEMSAVTALATAASNQGVSNNMIVTGTENGYIRVWELGRAEGGDAQMQSKFNAHSGRVTCLASEKSGEESGGGLISSFPRLVSGGADRTVRLWDPRVRKPQVFLFKGHTDTVNALLLDSNRACVVSGGRDQSVRIWDIRTGRQRSAMMEHFGSVNCLGISKDKSGGGSYLSSGRDGVICLWKRGSGEFTRSLRQGPNAKAVTCIGVKQGEGSDGGSRSISGSADGSIRIWDHNKGKCLKALSGHLGAVTSAIWSVGLGAGSIVSGGTDGQVRIWDSRGGRCLQWIQAHASSVTKVLVDSKYICSASRDGSLRVWTPVVG